MEVFLIEKIMIGEFESLRVWSAVIACAFVGIIFSSLVDLYYGVQAARARKEAILSNGLRRTIRKDIPYLTMVLLAFFCDAMVSMFPFWNYPFLTMFVGVCCILIEVKSVFEKLRIIKNPAADIPKTAEVLAERLNSETVEKILKLIMNSKNEHQ